MQHITSVDRNDVIRTDNLYKYKFKSLPTIIVNINPLNILILVKRYQTQRYRTSDLNMFEIRLNDSIKTILRDLCKEDKLPSGKDRVTKEEISMYIEKESIPTESLLNLYNLYWKDSEEVSLKKLMTPLDFKFKEKRKPGENYTKEFRKQLDKLRLIQQENEYQQLVNKEKEHSDLVHVKKGDELELSPAQINKQIKEQVTTIFNILLSVVSVVFAIWYWTGTSMRVEVQYRILLCLFFGILVLIAEVVVYNSYLNKIDEAKQKERKIKEKKKVIKTL